MIRVGKYMEESGSHVHTGMSVSGIQTWTDHDSLLTHAYHFQFHISSVQLKITHNQSVLFMIF